MDWSSGIAVIEIMVDIAMIVAVQIEKKKRFDKYLEKTKATGHKN